MSVRENRGHLEELYGIDVSADLISPSSIVRNIPYVIQ
jgi:hypothetical protein